MPGAYSQGSIGGKADLRLLGIIAWQSKRFVSGRAVAALKTP